MEPLVALNGASKAYGAAVVFENVSISIPPLRHVALVGPSGCGKSTLLRLIAGLDTPSSGDVWLYGQRASTPVGIDIPPHRRQLAMVFQDLALWPNLSALDNVVLGLSGAGVESRERIRRAMAALDLCGIGSLAARKPASLSGGQLQRVALARALAVQPRLLLLDEPFGSLDLTTRTAIYDEILKLCAEKGITILLVTHDPMEATALCSYGVVLEGGGIREEGEFDELLRHPVSGTLRAFVNRLPGRKGST